MKIYQHGMRGNGTVFVSPGADHPETSEWVDPESKRPRLITVKFTNGMADVDGNLGRYMIEKKLAQETPLILPAGVAA